MTKCWNPFFSVPKKQNLKTLKIEGFPAEIIEMGSKKPTYKTHIYNGFIMTKQTENKYNKYNNVKTKYIIMYIKQYLAPNKTYFVLIKTTCSNCT